MSKEPQQQRSVERRAAIVSATAKIMVLEGASAVSARRIAREAGVPVAAITYYFDSLAQILGEALIDGLEQRNAELVNTMHAAVLQKASRGRLSLRSPRFSATATRARWRCGTSSTA